MSAECRVPFEGLRALSMVEGQSAECTAFNAEHAENAEGGLGGTENPETGGRKCLSPEITVSPEFIS